MWLIFLLFTQDSMMIWCHSSLSSRFRPKNWYLPRKQNVLIVHFVVSMKKFAVEMIWIGTNGKWRFLWNNSSNIWLYPGLSPLVVNGRHRLFTMENDNSLQWPFTTIVNDAVRCITTIVNNDRKNSPFTTIVRIQRL